VLFGLFLLMLPGFAVVAKVVCARNGVELPHGKGFITIPSVINDEGTFEMTAEAQVDALAYGGPILLGGLMLTLGRLTCGAAPRISGAKGMFALSGLFTFVALIGLGIAAVCLKVLNYASEDAVKEWFFYAGTGCLIALVASEFWCLTGIAACGAALKEPRAPRAVGFLVFYVALVATIAVVTLGFSQYQPKYWDMLRNPDWALYEQGAMVAGWLLFIILYWRGVRRVRLAIREFLEVHPV
jgi:hypothetical protein